MRCDELFQRLTDHTEGVLDGEVCAEVERHLAECRTCAGVRQDLLDLSRLCRETKSLRLPDDVRHRIEGLLADGSRDATASSD